MIKVFVSYNNIISALGFSSESVVAEISNETSGVHRVEDITLLSTPFYASLIDNTKLDNEFNAIQTSEVYTRLEQLMILSLQKTMKHANVNLNDRVGLIISTTKGNIDTLEDASGFPSERAYLSTLGNRIKNHFQFEEEPIVLSNACVSGVLALAIAKRYIAAGTYDHVFVVGGDLVTEFILSGFNSFQAMSKERCRPYDKDRTGINIGEVVASALVTNSQEGLSPEAVEMLGEGCCNDANHISGPSRTGEGLVRSIESAMKEADVSAMDIDYISAHGTATTFNDEMEAVAFKRMHLDRVPVNSLKGYFGHSLGASGLVETIVGMHSMLHNMMYASLGYEVQGTTVPIAVIKTTTAKNLNTFLKTASGFGGCNTAAIFRKHKINFLNSHDA